MRISTDSDMTFGQMLKLGVNGTITDQYLQDLASGAIIAFMQKNHFKSNS
jgi:hypothetical protein